MSPTSGARGEGESRPWQALGTSGMPWHCLATGPIVQLLKSSSIRDEASCCHPCRWVPGRFEVHDPCQSPGCGSRCPKARGGLDAPPTEPPIVQQPRGVAHPPWGCNQPSSPRKQSNLCELRSGALTPRAHQGKCCCLLHPNLALVKIDSQNLGQTPPQASVMSGRDLLHSFRPDSSDQEFRSCLGTLQQKKPCGLHISDQGDSESETSHVPQTRPSNAVEQSRGDLEACPTP